MQLLIKQTKPSSNQGPIKKSSRPLNFLANSVSAIVDEIHQNRMENFEKINQRYKKRT